MPLSVLLYLCFALVRHLLANVIGLRMVLSGAVSFGHVVPSLVCNRVAPSPIPDASVSRHRGLVLSMNLMHTSFFINDFVLSYRASYDAFQFEIMNSPKNETKVHLK